MDYVDDTMSDGGGPWNVARGRKRKTAERSPFKTPLRSAHGRQHLGQTPAAIRSLPNVPADLRTQPMPHGERRATTVNPFVGTQASTGDAGIGRCEEGGVPAADNSLGTGLPQRTREPSASPVVAQGVANAAVDVAGNAEEFQRGDWDYRHYGVYDRVTDQGWAKLEQLSERPTARELLTLPINALQALIKRAGMSHGAYDTKKTLSAQLVEWLVTHPDLVLALPLDRL